MKHPGIFNEVIGPVMRGPSSSHTAASWRIARICLDLLSHPLQSAVIEFDKDGAWAPNYREQGTTIGIEGGLLGLDMTDDRMKYTKDLAKEKGIDIRYEIGSFRNDHVNSVRLGLVDAKGNDTSVLAASLGGGAMEIREINGFKVSLKGDYYELLCVHNQDTDAVSPLGSLIKLSKQLDTSDQNGKSMTTMKFSAAIPKSDLNSLKASQHIESIYFTKPVLPVIAGNEKALPFNTVESMLRYGETHNLDLGDLGRLYEGSLSGLDPIDLNAKMDAMITIIHGSIAGGLAGTSYEDRLLPRQSHLIAKSASAGAIPQNTLINNIISNVSAIMESKSAMEVIAANPTAGSCGAVGGVLKAVADDIEAPYEHLVKAYFAAGMVGVFFAMGPGFSAEEHGCQVECGASAGMAAAGIVQLYGGSAKHAVEAASMAIQNMIGLICDPIADRVEAPCLGKNVSAAVNALSSATMVCAGFNALIPLDEVIDTVSRVSLQMPSCNKCTGKGGLAITPTACRLKRELSD
jgi:L-serine dehydratase